MQGICFNPLNNIIMISLLSKTSEFEDLKDFEKLTIAKLYIKMLQKNFTKLKRNNNSLKRDNDILLRDNIYLTEKNQPGDRS